MKSLTLKLLIILSILMLYSCEKEKCGDPIEFPSSFGFVLHDVNGKDLVYNLGINPE